MKKLFWIGLAVSACSYGGTITLTGGTSTVTFSGTTISYSGALSGGFNVPFGMLNIPVTWSIGNSTFTYDSNGLITAGNPVTFMLSGLDDIVMGTASLSQAENGPSSTAFLLGTMTVTSNVNGGMITGDGYLENVLAGAAGGPIVSGEMFNLVIDVTGCTPGACVSIDDPTGTASAITLTPSSVPEPATYALMGGGLAALGLLKRRHGRRTA